MIILSSLKRNQEAELVAILKSHRNSIELNVADIKGISPLICIHHFYLEEDVKQSRQPQRRLNPHMKDVVQNKVLKLLDVKIIYPIIDRKWVSPT